MNDNGLFGFLGRVYDSLSHVDEYSLHGGNGIISFVSMNWGLSATGSIFNKIYYDYNFVPVLMDDDDHLLLPRIFPARLTNQRVWEI